MHEHHRRVYRESALHVCILSSLARLHARASHHTSSVFCVASRSLATTNCEAFTRWFYIDTGATLVVLKAVHVTMPAVEHTSGR